MDTQLLIQRQMEVCQKYGVPYFGCDLELKLGISKNVRGGEMPIRGLRIVPDPVTCGWYIWAGGERSDDEDFFLPLHALHLSEWAPLVLPYLGLPPGWRFIVTPTYEDVWWDERLVPRG